MNDYEKRIFFFFLKLFLIALFLSPFLDSAHGEGLPELFDLYSSTQTLSMGNAQTADATGYLANYYNPAGLAKISRRRPDIIIVDAEANVGATAVGNIANAGSLGIYQMMPVMAKTPNYNFYKFSSVVGYARRNFALTFLADYQYAAQATGGNIAIDSGYTLGPTLGAGFNLAGNILKLGFSVKGLLRTELNGTYSIASFSSANSVFAAMTSGLGVGGDVGMMITLPYKFLPTLGEVWQDVLNTQFIYSPILNPSATSAPIPIPQSVNLGLSVKPSFGKKLKATFNADLRHLERTDLPITKLLHFGFQLEAGRAWYFWVGLNQMFPTGGIALRLPGGNFELGSYAQDIGAGSTSIADRRFLVRYTISF